MKSFPLEAVEKCSTAELKRLQLERLRGSLAHAYDNVPRYREKFDAAGVKQSATNAVTIRFFIDAPPIATPAILVQGPTSAVADLSQPRGKGAGRSLAFAHLSTHREQDCAVRR